MACVQACGSADAYQTKHNNVVIEMCHKAHNLVNKHCHEHGAITGGHIQNNTNPNSIKFLSKHDWSGRSKVPYPHTIPKLHGGEFVHNADFNNGHKDEGAVVYTDECGSGWLLAWSVQDHCGGHGNHNKVYVEGGPIENYVAVDWSDIKAKLDESCDTSYYVDETTGCEAFGKISHGNKAALVVTFNNY